jgi:hypothetical protein
VSLNAHRRHAFWLREGIPLTPAQMDEIEQKIYPHRRWYYAKDLKDMRRRKGMLRSLGTTVGRKKSA